MATKRTMRRVPEDVEEARYIHGLVKNDLGSKIIGLAQDGDLVTIHRLTGYLTTWEGVVADLSESAFARAVSDGVSVTGEESTHATNVADAGAGTNTYVPPGTVDLTPPLAPDSATEPTEGGKPPRRSAKP
jgi:hypothetical protein